MLSKETISAQLAQCIDRVDLSGYGDCIRGKVRDCYVLGDKRILIASDRLSAFDRVLTTIPFKGQLLNQMTSFWFNKTKHIVDNHILAHPHPNVFICQEVEIIPVEVVVRGYLAGSAWRDYEAGRDISGIKLRDGLSKFQQLDEPVITPSTKALHGKHDEPISESEILSRKLVDADIWARVRSSALSLFKFGSQQAAQRDLILVDTKYEFGVISTPQETKVVLADEIHTQDSSRYWVASSYKNNLANGQDPEMLDKEFVRRDLIARGYMGDGPLPEFTQEFRIETCLRYIDVFERLTGQEFKPTIVAQEQIQEMVDGYFSGN